MEPLPSANCQRCHDPRKVQPSGELVVPHESHRAAGVECLSCHEGLAHKEPPPPWGKMQACMDCHQAKEAANSCITCHHDLGVLTGK